MRAGLRSADAFTVRRAQVLLASDQGSRPPHIARNLGCAVGTVHHAIHAFDRDGLACLRPKSSRPHSARAFLDEARAEALRELLHQSPRLSGKPTSLWTLRLLAEVTDEGAFAEVIIDHARAAGGAQARPDLRRMLVPIGPVAVSACVTP